MLCPNNHHHQHPPTWPKEHVGTLWDLTEEPSGQYSSCLHLLEEVPSTLCLQHPASNNPINCPDKKNIMSLLLQIRLQSTKHSENQLALLNSRRWDKAREHINKQNKESSSCLRCCQSVVSFNHNTLIFHAVDE
jgi:hypothetical protein